MSGNGAVFLDRDGTIHEEVGYLSRLDQLKLFPGTAEAVTLIHEMGRKAVVITNQSGVARGFFDEGFLHEVHGEINARLEKKGTRIDAFYYCPHHPHFGAPPYKKDCDCRKPNPGLFFRAAADLGIDLHRSYMIGDMLKDMVAARHAGAGGILVRTGYGVNIPRADRVLYQADDILDAVRWIREREP